ncbi:steroid receptor RNA activator 1-like [Liolophura sinensis]|uniref:steroid receptor RNA activator 1-like n=1 Tax=Liolophura sinensis TaxID=3198878 RepID=UPI003158FC65
MAESKPGNPERGWNDPPVFSFAPSSTNTAESSPRRTVLNKRVAFPLSGPTNIPASSDSGDGSLLPPESGPPVTSGVLLLPPALDTTTPLPVPLVVPNLVPASPPVSPTLGTDKLTESVERCMERLGCSTDGEFLTLVEGHLQTAFESCKECLKERAKEEIRKKMLLFREAWEQNNISSPVKVKMSYLAIALTEKRFAAAFDIHLGLMVDYTAEVNNWMVGIKRLIHECKLRSEAIQGGEVCQGKRSGEGESPENTQSDNGSSEAHCDKKPKLEESPSTGS